MVKTLLHELVLPLRHHGEQVGRSRVVPVAEADGLERVLAVLIAPQVEVAASELVAASVGASAMMPVGSAGSRQAVRSTAKSTNNATEAHRRMRYLQCTGAGIA